MTINKRWFKSNNKFSPYEDILLDENDLKHISSLDWEAFNKLLEITKAELWMKALEGKITTEQAQGAILFAKYLKWYFNK